MNLRRRIVIYFVCMYAVIIGAVGLFSYHSGSAILRDAVSAELLATAIEKERSINDWLDKILNETARYAVNPDVIKSMDKLSTAFPESEDARSARSVLLQSLKSLVDEPGGPIAKGLVIDVADEKLIVSTDPAEIGTSGPEHGYLEGNGPVRQIRPMFLTESQKVELIATHPLRNSGGQALAVIVVQIHLNDLAVLVMSRTGLHQTDDSFIVDSRQVALTPPFLTQTLLGRKIDSEAARSCAARNSGLVLAADYRGTPVIAVCRWNTKGNFGLIVKIDQAEAFAPLRILAFEIALLTCLALLVAAGTSVLLARSISRPLAQLREKALSFGQVNSDEPQSVFYDQDISGDEVTLLDGAFDQMSARIIRKAAELEKAIVAEAGSAARLRLIFDSVNEGIFITDRETGTFIDANTSGCRMFGYSINELRGASIEMLSSGVPPYTQIDVIKQIQKARLNGPQTFEWHAKAKDGHLFWIELSLRETKIDGKTVLLSIVRDITERKRSSEQVSYAARHDGLTGLYNRAVFVEWLNRAIASASRGGKHFGVLYLDLDHFKDVNDVLGHPIGDELLQAVVKRLLAIVRENDVVARFGGDEFCLLINDLDEPADVALVADKLLKALSEAFLIGGNDIRTGASIGIEVYGTSALDAEKLLSNADIALYRAKSEGRGTYRFFTDAMNVEVLARVAIANELRTAIAAGQFFLMYQPQVDIDTGRIIGVEALLRWNRPTLDPPSVHEYILVAEKIGLVVPLGQWVLREACRQMREWLDMGIAPPLIGVNVSGLQFKTPFELEHDVAAVLAETALPPRCLELELTETVLMQVSREHSETLLRLRKMGLRVAIDDFGTGYSSLEYLSHFAVNRIKIAQNFTRDLTSNAEASKIVKAAIGLAHDLGFDVVVEGVETAEQLEMVRSFGCHEVQGFIFSKPLSAREAAAVLRAGKISLAPSVTIEAAE